MASVELASPERPPRPTITVKTPEGWKRPEEVMRMYRFRMKQKALQSRMSKAAQPDVLKPSLNASVDSAVDLDKRKNPFKRMATTTDSNNLKKLKETEDEAYAQGSSLFQLLRLDSSSSSASRDGKLQEPVTSFKNILSRSSSFTFGSNNSSRTSGSFSDKDEPVIKMKGSKCVPVDWKLRTKVRFMSCKPFSWNQKLKTCEEASGTTGFVRCLDTTNDENCSLDISANAQFHQCCLVWQHPVLPWVELYPRHVVQAHNDSSPTFATQPSVRDSLHRAWSESFRSVFQLVRAQQCPYFYVLANSFTCLFRAAGICGHGETHAIITPTTRGFRQMLKDEEIVFTMPLRDNDGRRRSFENQTQDTGYSSLDMANDASTIGESGGKNVKEDEEGEGEEEEEDEDAEQWLQSMGVEEAEIKKIRNSQSDIDFGKEKKLDKMPESLVYVEGIEAQALFNFLMNCKSNTAATGPLAGIPPTLLAPVAFHGATLQPLKVRESIVNVGGQQYHSMELRGPVLPHTIHSLCEILKHSLDEFSLTFASIESTAAFTLMHGKTLEEKSSENEDDVKKPADNNEDSKMSSSGAKTAFSSKNKPPSNVFGRENLSDCGLRPEILKEFCKSETDTVQEFDSLKYSEKIFSWS